MATRARLFGKPALGDHKRREKAGAMVSWALEWDTTHKQARHATLKLINYMMEHGIEFEDGDCILIEGNVPN